jgi:prevent-host-death family protein
MKAGSTMQTITSTDFARNPRGVFDRVIETQAPIEITRHGKPVVRVQPIAPARRALSGPELVARMAASTHRVAGADAAWQKDYDEVINPIEEFVDPWAR